jgi:hypothetical protein
MMPGSVNRDFDGSNVTPYAATYALNPVMDEDLSEDGCRKKAQIFLHVSPGLSSLTTYYPAQKVACR